MISKLSSAAAVFEAIFSTAGNASMVEQKGSAYDFVFTSIDGAPLPLEGFRGRAILIVNTASRCGFNFQYAGLQETWQTYQDKGLVVIGVPSNDFGYQEPKGEIELKRFCCGTYAVTFPLAGKTKIRGPNAHEFYKWATEALGEKSKPRWNFHKYLVNSDGKLVAWFAPTVTPRSRRLAGAIEDALPKAG